MAEVEPRTPEQLLEDFLERQVEEGLDFERFVSSHPEQEAELRRLIELVPLARRSGGRAGAPSTTTFFSARARPRFDPNTVDLAPGTRVAGFELVRPIGRGGMGEVWEAHQIALDRQVAVKFIRSEDLTDSQVRRFQLEARAGGRINHPGIVAFYDHGTSDGRQWIAQELVGEGCTLLDAIRRFEALEVFPRDHWRRIAQLFVTLADALQAAHDAGVLHCDIKPQNVLIDPHDTPKISDFGLARVKSEAAITRLGLEGTPQYMSPEQAGFGETVDARSDVFSLGVVLYEVLTRRRAFDGSNVFAILNRILRVDPPAPNELDPRIPEELSVITMGALEKRPSERYGSMRELSDELGRFLRDEPILRQPPGPLERLRKWTRRNRWLATAAALAGLLIVSLAILAPAIARRQAEVKQAELQNLELRVQWAIDRGQLPAARTLADEAVALAPSDPLPHLLLAAGYAGTAQMIEAEEQLEQARAKGFDASPPPMEDAGEDPGEDGAEAARRHLEYGLYALGRGRAATWREAEQHLARAFALDDELSSTLFPLYQLRRALGDEEGARESLDELARRLPPADDFRTVVDALRLEMDGRPGDALERLAELGSRSEEERNRLRLHRLQAKCLLELGDDAGAERELETHLTAFPDDHTALEQYATLELRRLQATTGLDEARLEHAEELAGHAAAIDDSWARPQALLVEAGLLRIERREDLYAPIPEDWLRSLEEHMETLEELQEGGGDSPADEAPLEEYRARLAFLASLPIERAGDLDGAIRSLEECLQHDPTQFRAACLLSQHLWSRDRDREALELLRQADRNWRVDQDPEGHWRLAIDVWRFGYADRLGDTHEAREALLSATEHASDADLQWAEMLTMAEFLATAVTPALRDCELARAWIDDWNLESQRDRPHAAGTLDLIEESCGGG